MLATHLLDTIPSVMREWRRELHSGLPDGLSINQFRVLFFVNVGHESSCFLARHLGVTAAAMSKMVEVLVKRELLNREVNPNDRRHVRLTLTRAGQTVVRRVRTQVEKNMQVHLDDLNNKEQKQVLEALLLLQKVFSSNRGEVVA